jgi:hypothetical protein
MGASTDAAPRPVSSPLSLEWTSSDISGTYPTACGPLPSGVYHTHLPGYIVKGFDMFCSMREHKLGLTQHETCSCSIEVSLVLLNFDRKVGDVVIDLPIPSDLSCQAPVVSVSHSGLKDLKFAAGAGEQVSEPCGQSVDR